MHQALEQGRTPKQDFCAYIVKTGYCERESEPEEEEQEWEDVVLQ